MHEYHNTIRYAQYHDDFPSIQSKISEAYSTELLSYPSDIVFGLRFESDSENFVEYLTVRLCPKDFSVLSIQLIHQQFNWQRNKPQTKLGMQRSFESKRIQALIIQISVKYEVFSVFDQSEKCRCGPLILIKTLVVIADLSQVVFSTLRFFNPSLQ